MTIAEPNIVEDYYIGNTRIKIANDCYIDKSSEDIQKILERLAVIGWRYIESAGGEL